MQPGHLGNGFINHAKLALVRDATTLRDGIEYNPNWVEKSGYLFSWHLVELPRRAVGALYDPKFLTVAITIAAMTAVQFAFYPQHTMEALTWTAEQFLLHVPVWKVKFGCYAITELGILGLGLRAMGRFTNDHLMNQWYGNEPAAQL